MKPDSSNLSEHYGRYMNLIEEDDIIAAFDNHDEEAFRFFEGISENQSKYRYAPEKWTIKEVLQHVIDAERIFDYRALALARGEKNPLSSFDEKAYAVRSNANRRAWKSLTSEFRQVRLSSKMLAESLDEESLQSTGIVSGSPITVLTILYLLIGHGMHHINIIKTRYLV